MISDKSKPLGIVLIAIYSALMGLLSLLASILALLFVMVPSVSLWALLFGSLLIISAIFSFAAAYGLWALQPWGCRVAFWLYVVSIPLGLAAIFPIFPDSEMTPANTMFQLIVIGIDIAIIFYLSGIMRHAEIAAKFNMRGLS